MLILLSPAKNLNEARAAGQARTTPRFLDEAEELASVARGWSAEDIGEIMKVSPAIADLNVQRFAEWTRDADLAAGDMFDGDVYKSLEFATLDDAGRAEAQRRLRILSGLYGLLRPGDAAHPYRLEMGRKLKGHGAGTLYEFWADKIARQVARDAEDADADTILNLASAEYTKAVDRNALSGLTLVEPRFEQDRGGKRKVIGIMAKRARGAMARWVLEHGITEAADLRDFNVGGYSFDPDVSTPGRPVFLAA